MAITDFTRDRLRALETKAFEAGLSPSQLAKEIEGVIDDPARALRIAQTDLAMAQAEGSLEAWRESELVTGKEALLSNDHDKEDVCDDCVDAGVIPLDEEFPSGTLTVPFHPGGCQCDVAAVME